MLSFSAWANPWQELVAAGVSHRLDGNLSTAIALLSKARQTANTQQDSALASSELGAAFLQAQRLEEAEEALTAAYGMLAGEARARVAMDIGNLAVYRRQTERAVRYYREAEQLSASVPEIRVAAALNLARLVQTGGRQASLASLQPDIERLANPSVRAQLLLNLGIQAQSLDQSSLALAYNALDQAHKLAAATQQPRIQIAALNALGQLYYDQQRWEDTLELNMHALRIARPLSPSLLRDLLLNLEWQHGRVQTALSRPDEALAAYQRAVEHAQTLRQDLPIQMADGRSSYQALLQPLFLEYIELLLDTLQRQPSERQQITLMQVRNALETLRQVEMQDFLGDRCSVEESGSTGLEPGVAILYPIVLKDRLDLLVETRQGLVHRSIPVARNALVRASRDFAQALRDGRINYKPQARTLYDWLLRPIDDVLAATQTDTLVIASDGALRLIPFAAMHDGKQFLIERFGVVSVTGMSMTNLGGANASAFSALLAGVAEPGPVVDKLVATNILRSAGGSSRGINIGGQLMQGRSLRSIVEPEASTSRDIERALLQKSLALPGVSEEVRSIGSMLNGRVLLDKTFSVNQFRDEAEGGSYRIVHIASHGVFGGSAETSFILAYDDLLGINRLQSLLQSERLQTNPIELLTLSACETADGNERAPLGISGAAIRARAKSVLGTLWPVEDNAARLAMETFYRGLTKQHMSKAAAMQQAQQELIRKPEYEHPFFWAPFSLIGNWR